MRRVLEWGGIAAGIVLVAFGVATIVLGVNGRSTVHVSLMLEQIVGTPDMTPAAIKAEAQKAGLSGSLKAERSRASGPGSRFDPTRLSGGPQAVSSPRCRPTGPSPSPRKSGSSRR